MTRSRIVLAGLALALASGAVSLESATRPAAIPAFDAVRADYRSSEATLLDRHGRPLQTLRMDYQARRLDWVPLEDISDFLRSAVIVAEDRRFDAHPGVDALAILGALRDRARGQSRRGASTLEMQLAAQLDPTLRSRERRRGLLQKLQQMRAALALSGDWSKAQVLEAYLNLVSFRGETQGIAAASRALFDQAPVDLGPDEIWTLVALLPAPGAGAEAVARRACAIAMAGDGSAPYNPLPSDLRRHSRESGNPVAARRPGHGSFSGDWIPASAGMTDAGKEVVASTSEESADCGALRLLASQALAKPGLAPRLTADAAPHLARRLLRAPGERIASTLDPGIQALAARALDDQLRALVAQEVRDAAAVVVDNASGEVLAYVGSAGSSTRAGQVDGARALRQAGSTLKPFLYGLAIERNWITAASLLDDAPVALEAGPGLYLPQNYEHDYKGLVSVRNALAGSLNIPAVRTLLITGIEPFRERLRALGFTEGLTESGEYYGYSLALGSAEVSLLEQVNAYRSLANGGLWSPLRLRMDEPATPSSRSVLSPAAAWIVSDVLSDRAARALTFDFDGPLSTPYWSAVKTGTSKNLRDNWCIGYTQRHTVGVWVGNFEGDPMRAVSGITGSAPAWREIMDALEAGNESQAPSPPAGMVRSRVQFAAGGEPARDEWFIAGTETAQMQTAPPTAARPRLASPAAGSLIALDPDIPLDRQHVLLRAEPASAELRLRLNDRELGNAAQPQLWTPLPGEHQLVLLDASGRALDQVNFSVRAPR